MSYIDHRNAENPIHAYHQFQKETVNLVSELFQKDKYFKRMEEQCVIVSVRAVLLRQWMLDIVEESCCFRSF